MSPALKGTYKGVLVQAANSLLASRTWSSHSTVYKQSPIISEETGGKDEVPYDNQHGAGHHRVLPDEGLKTNTIQGILASIKNLHQVRGLKCPALDEKLIQTILKGVKNMESLREAEVRGVVTIKTMKKLWKRFQESDLALDTKRMLWDIFTLLFLGSLRPQRPLAQRRGSTTWSRLTWKDVKLLCYCMDVEEVEFLQQTSESLHGRECWEGIQARSFNSSFQKSRFFEHFAVI